MDLPGGGRFLTELRQWSTCFSRSEKEFKAANEAFLLKRWAEGLEHLIRAQQWLAETHKYLREEA